MVEGVYDEYSHRIFLVRDELGSNKAHADVVLSHELDHAVDQQHFGSVGLLADPASGAGDATRALREGTATVVQLLYEIRYEHRPGPLARLLAHPNRLPNPRSAVERLADEQLVFTYLAGARFVAELYQRGHGWGLVNRAWRDAPSTQAQILHPELWLAGRGANNPTASARPYLAGWSQVGSGDVGEQDIAVILGHANTPAQAAAAAPGWTGGRFEIWQHQNRLVQCPLPCRPSSVGLIEVTWQTPADARRFGQQLAAYLQTRLHSRPAGTAEWTIPPPGHGGAGAAALVTMATTTTLAFAPTSPLAHTIAVGTARRDTTR